MEFGTYSDYGASTLSQRHEAGVEKSKVICIWNAKQRNLLLNFDPNFSKSNVYFKKSFP